MKRRTGFTLVELLVAMALIVFILAILSEAFAAGVATFRGLKSIGELNERLRMASTLMRRNLAADHFEAKKRLSDISFWDEGPPREGFFRIYQGSPPVEEPNPLDGVRSFRATDHALHFTVKLRGNERSQLFMTNVPAGSPLLSLKNPLGRFQDLGAYTYPWAEVAFFLRDSGDVLPNGTALHTLYYRHRLLVPSNDEVGGPVSASEIGKYLEVSCWDKDGNLYFNNAVDVTVPSQRFGIGASGELSGTRYPTLAEQDPSLAGGDVLVTNVVSMNIRVLAAGQTEFKDLYELAATYPSRHPNFDEGNEPRIFDTWSKLRDDNNNDFTGWATPSTPNSIPMYLATDNSTRIRILAVQITIRVWDSRTELSRQVTIVQDL